MKLLIATLIILIVPTMSVSADYLACDSYGDDIKACADQCMKSYQTCYEEGRREINAATIANLTECDNERSSCLSGCGCDGSKTSVLPEIKSYINREQIDTNSQQWRTKLPIFPEVSFSDNKKYFWNIETSEGPIKIKFDTVGAPKHVTNFIYLSELGYFNGLTFHRVIPGFMAQGGCPVGNGTGNPGYKFSGEFSSNTQHSKPGILSMANAGPNTDGSQFFITFVPTPNLDGKHTIFGEVVEGMDTLIKIESKGSRSGRTQEEILIVKAHISVE